MALAACRGAETPYDARAKLARAAYERGEYEAAAQYWQEARAVSESTRDRDEATYRAAHSLLRAGHTDAGERLLSELRATERGGRGARASFDLALREIQSGDPARGHEQLRRALLAHPDHGVARDALRRRRAYLVQTAGSEAAERDLADLGVALAGSELESTAWFERAKLLEAREQLELALAAYIDVADRFPYPSGAYWNDATLAAARLEARLERRGAARERLERMLEQREHSALTGSYERGYDRAQYLLAELVLDEGRWREARELWIGLPASFPESLLCDDALWAAALLSARNQDPARACDLARRILADEPDSRYAACTGLVCEEPPHRTDACADYVRRSVADGALRPTPTFD